jgi:hypothetical protein
MFLIDKLAPIEMPKFLEIIEVIPKTAVGKVSRKRLQHREQARSRHRRTSCHQLNGLHKRKKASQHTIERRKRKWPA